MPLGASITAGTGSPDLNGYRSRLRSLLVADGNPVDMVGSRASGNMTDNQHEGWPGRRIHEVFEKARASVPARLPNLVTLNAGTNDCAVGYDVDAAGERMEELLDYLWTASPKVSVVLSTLLVNGNSTIEKCVLAVNEQLTTLTADLTAKSKKIILVDMHAADGPQEYDLVDGTHPDAAGYEKMAGIWFAGIQEAASRGWLESPQVLPGSMTTSTTTAAATSVGSMPDGSDKTETHAVASETATVGVKDTSDDQETDSASSSQETQGGDSRASRTAGYPTMALVLAMSTLFLFT